MKTWWRPFNRLKSIIFMAAAQAPDMEGWASSGHCKCMRTYIPHFYCCILVPACYNLWRMYMPNLRAVIRTNLHTLFCYPLSCCVPLTEVICSTCLDWFAWSNTLCQHAFWVTIPLGWVILVCVFSYILYAIMPHNEARLCACRPVQSCM